MEEYDAGVYNNKNVNESRKGYTSARMISESGGGCDEMNRWGRDVEMPTDKWAESHEVQVKRLYHCTYDGFIHLSVRYWMNIEKVTWRNRYTYE